MADIKSTLSLLCQHLKLSTDVSLKPEYFRSAKFNNPTENVTAEFWKLLVILGVRAIKEKGLRVEFLEYDTQTVAKLCFAYLQYTVVEFYNLSENSSDSRQLLLAFAWLVGTQDVLNAIVKACLVKSCLSKECSPTNLTPKTESEATLNSLSAEANNIIRLNNKVNSNIKEISELVSEKVNLASKVHIATRNVSGLPHLSVAELALLKNLSVNKKDTCSVDVKNRLEELSKLGNLLDVHSKWLKRENIFFDWMLTVVQEQNKFLDTNEPNNDWKELVKFMCLLDHIIKKKTEEEPNKETCNSGVECVSRLLRIEKGETETAEWLVHANKLLSQESEAFRKKKEELSRELKGMLKLIPFCVQIQ